MTSSNPSPAVSEKPLDYLSSLKRELRRTRRLDEVHRILVWERLKELTPDPEPASGAFFADVYHLDGKLYRVSWSSFDETPSVIDEYDPEIA